MDPNGAIWISYIFLRPIPTDVLCTAFVRLHQTGWGEAGRDARFIVICIQKGTSSDGMSGESRTTS